MTKGYTTLQAVAAACAADGVTLTPQQELLVGMDLPVVEAAIDAFTGRAWLLGAITGEEVYPVQGVLWLTQRPVATIEAIRQIGGLPPITTPLTADVDYTLVDAAQGRVGIVAGLGWGTEAWASGYILQSPGYGSSWPGGGLTGYRYAVDYTPVETVPPLVAWAARETARAWIMPFVSGIDDDVQRLSVFGQITVAYQRRLATDTGVLRELPEVVQAKLKSLKAAVL